MKETHLFGRIIFAMFYLFNAFNHFTHIGAMSHYAAAKSVPLPGLAVVVTGILMTVAGVALLLGRWPRVAIGALVLFFIPVTLFMHAFWRVTDPAMRIHEMVNFMKNVALMGSTMMLAAIPEPWPYSVHAPSMKRDVHEATTAH